MFTYFLLCNSWADNLSKRRVHALCTVLGDTGSYPSQFDQSHLRDDDGVFGSQYEGYIGDPYGSGEYKVKVRPAPSTGDQPYGKPSQYDKVKLAGRDEADGGRYHPYAPGRVRETDYANRSGPPSREKPSQFDQKWRTGQGRGNGWQIFGASPWLWKFKPRRAAFARSKKPKTTYFTVWQNFSAFWR